MKRVSTLLFTLGSFVLAGNFNSISAQCNVNDKYDKIISGYHSSIALKSNGTYAVWGAYMQKTGNTDQLSPQDINATNYTGLTGTILKAALGGSKAGAAVDQGILLTSSGLWAWGVKGAVLNTTQAGVSTFARITSPTGAETTGLPTGILPDSVANMIATYQTLFLLTKGGNVWVLTQASLAIEANGGTAGSAGSSTWKQVKTGAGVNLQQVIAVRGQVSSNSLNAFFALTASGKLYTWGNSTYLGDGNGVAARNYATQMSLPAGFTGTIKMIGVTGGIAQSGYTSTKNTYYLLDETGKLYSLGDNSQKQCGDFTTTERTSWVRVQKSATSGDYLTNINYISAQEHNSSFPGIAAINSSGQLYTWGNNSSGMLSRTSDNTTSGSATSVVSYDPGIAVGFSGVAISVEVGGHTMVYLKEGSDRFCYAGHQIQGSMGDGTTTGAGTTSSATLIHTCSSTPQLEVCGYVPVVASVLNSEISASTNLITANGISTSTITIRLKDASGNYLTKSGGVVTVTTSEGTLGTVVDNNDGTYTVILTSSNSQVTAEIGFAINGTAASSTTNVVFSSNLPVKWGDSRAYRKYKTQVVEWTTEEETNISHFQVERSINGRDWTIVLNKKQPTNATGRHNYSFTDNEYIPGIVNYRVRELDLDGKSAYSVVMMIEADAGFNRIIAYPSPADKLLYVGNIEKSKLGTITLYSINGEKIREWNQPKDSYDLSGVQPGIYLLKVNTKDGGQQTIRIKKL